MRIRPGQTELPVLSLLTLAVCVCVHEGGHVLATYATGGQLLEFRLFSTVPHVVVTEAATKGIEAFRAMAGSALTLGIGSLLIAVLGWRRSVITESIALFCLIELTGWTASALGWGDATNDAATFIGCTGISGSVLAFLCVSLGALIVLGIAMRSHAVRPGVVTAPAVAGRKGVIGPTPQVATPLA